MVVRQRLGMFSALVTLGLTAGSAAAATSVATLYATNTEISATNGWNYEDKARGEPQGNCLSQANGYAASSGTDPSTPVAGNWLKATDFDAYSLPSRHRVTRVTIGFFGGWNSGSSLGEARRNLVIQVYKSGNRLHEFANNFYFDNGCGWRPSSATAGGAPYLIGEGEINITPFLSASPNEADINNLRVWIRRHSPTSPDAEINIDAVRIKVYSETDSDGDGVVDSQDGCPTNSALTALGPCGCSTVDTDGDGRYDCVDNCPTISNASQADADGDGRGDACDNCPTVSNATQTNQDGDAAGDACDACVTNPALVSPGACGCSTVDTDGDGRLDCIDNCRFISNVNQKDVDADGIGDVCDNCPQTFNPDQANSDTDGLGNACDNCRLTTNPGQEDADTDGVGDSCDNCRTVANASQTDSNGNGVGDVCECVSCISQTCLGGDCDADGQVDYKEIHLCLTQRDCNANGVPDDCELGGMAAAAAYRVWRSDLNGPQPFGSGSSWCNPDANGSMNAPSAVQAALFHNAQQSAEAITSPASTVGSVQVWSGSATLRGGLTFEPGATTPAVVVGRPAWVNGPATSTAYLYLENGAFGEPNLNRLIEIAPKPGTSAVLTLRLGATLASRSDLLIGASANSGPAGLVIESGARVDVYRDIKVGAEDSGSATAIVSGPGSLLRSSTREVRVNSGSKLSLENGGMVNGLPGIGVSPAGLLEGNGTVGPVLSNAGTVSPGHGRGDVGNITVTNQFIQANDPSRNTAGMLEMDIVSAASYDRLTVNGLVTLGGGLRVWMDPAYNPANSDRFDLISATLINSLNPFDVAFLPSLLPDPVTGYVRKLRQVVITAGPTHTFTLLVDATSLNSEYQNPIGSPFPGVPVNAAAGDFDADGKLDIALAVPNQSDPEGGLGAVAVLFNDAPLNSGRFISRGQIDIKVGRNPKGLAVDDMNGDGLPDIVVTNASGNSMQVLLNRASTPGVFDAGDQVPSGGTAPIAIALADMNADGSPDVVCANSGVFGSDPGNMAIFLNSPASSGGLLFDSLAPVGLNPRDVLVHDFDGDGLRDIVSADYGSSRLTLLIRSGSGPIRWLPPRHYPTQTRPEIVEPGGLDNPKDVVAFIAAIGTQPDGSGEGAVAVFRVAPGGGALMPGVEVQGLYEPRSLAVLDMDDDGDPDLAIVKKDVMSGQRVIKVFRNDTEGSGPGSVLVFADDPYQPPARNPLLLVAGDFSVPQDGRTDLFSLNAPNAVALRAPAGEPMRNPTPEQARQEQASRDAGEPPLSLMFKPAPRVCLGDLSDDGHVGTADLPILLSAFGGPASQATGRPSPDLNGDGMVSTPDLVIFIGRFGAVCLR